MATLNRRFEPKQPRRDPFRAVYQSERWHRYSRQYRKANPLCKHCLKEGKTAPAECVDHIVPLMLGGDIWNPTNHQGLCNHHHAIKTKAEQ